MEASRFFMVVQASVQRHSERSIKKSRPLDFAQGDNVLTKSEFLPDQKSLLTKRDKCVHSMNDTGRLRLSLY